MPLQPIVGDIVTTTGNSLPGMHALELFAALTGLSVF